MFFTLSKLVGPLLQPLPLFFGVAVVIAFRVRAGLWRRLFVLTLVGLWGSSAGFVSNALLVWWEGAYPPIAIEDVPPADAIVVLAGMLQLSPSHGRSDRLEFNDAVDRILAGAALLRADRASLLVLSGGSGRLFGRDELESPLLASWLMEVGSIPEGRILVEAGSRTTSESAREVARLARERGWERVVLVTSARHMRRAELCFRKAGLATVPFPVDYLGTARGLTPAALLPSASALYSNRRLWREWLGLLAYRLAGRI